MAEDTPDPVTVKVRGEGGAVFDMDIPPAGTFQRENFDGMVSKGWLTILEGNVPTDTPENEPVPAVEEPEVKPTRRTRKAAD